jgi:hypothetical protein
MWYVFSEMASPGAVIWHILSYRVLIGTCQVACCVDMATEVDQSPATTWL